MAWNFLVLCVYLSERFIIDVFRADNQPEMHNVDSAVVYKRWSG